MEKTRKISTILVLVLAFCFVLVSLAQATDTDEGKQWAKKNLKNRKKAVSIPIWQITQDGIAGSVDWQDHAPNPRFAIYDNGTLGDLSDDLVLDKETGLVWARDANLLAGATKQWGDAISYCREQVTLANRKGWKLPTIEEFLTLIDPSHSNPALPYGNPFINVLPDRYYWSCTTNEFSSDGAWRVYIGNGGIYAADKTYACRLWPVRGGNGYNAGNDDVVNLLRDEVIPKLDMCCGGVPKTGQTTKFEDGDDGDLRMGISWPSPRFTDHGDGTVTDNMTGLMWTKDAEQISGQITWTDGLAACNTLDFAGHDDWRLPSIKELQSLVDYGETGPALPNGGNAFMNVWSAFYWSSTTDNGVTANAWIVGMGGGYIGSYTKGNSYYVWPVRGGR